MNSYCEKFYQHLQRDIELCKATTISYHKEVESCFGTVVKYWMELSEKLSKHEFQSDEEEIEFFKKWKPKFISEIEYYNLIYHSLLFQPAEPNSLISFWGRE